MKRATLLTVLLASGVLLAGAAQVSAQSFSSSGAAVTTTTTSTTAEQAPAPAAREDFVSGHLTFQLLGRNDIESSKFEEYRDVVKGASVPRFNVTGSAGALRYDLRGENVKQRDERYTGTLKTDFFAVTADYNAIIHRIGNNGRTMLAEQSPGVWRMSDTLQQAFQNTWESTPTANRIFTTFVQPLFLPSILDGSVVDVQVQRQRNNVVVDIARNQPLTLRVSYAREQRHGSGGLSTNYLSYTTETPAVTEYLTQDVGFNAGLNKPWGNLRAGLRYNWFIDQVKSLAFDSPFRATDALVATITLPGGATSVGGPASGRMVNPPDSSAYTGTFGATLKARANTRITADVALGRLAQNDQLFPYITNTAVVTPIVGSSASALPVQSLNGKINTTALTVAVTSKPTEPLQLNLRYRRYDLDNQTPRITFPYTGSWDRSLSTTARVTVPYGYVNDRFDASANVLVGKVTFEGAYRRTMMDRTFRETERTTENAGSVAAIVKVGDIANLRAVFEKAERRYDTAGLELERSEDTSLLVPPTGLASNLLARSGNLRFDQANRDTDRAGFDVTLSPNSLATLSFSYLHNKDTYLDTAHGVQDGSYDTLTGEVAVSPSERSDLFVYYSHEKNGSAQIQNGTSGFPTIDDFTIRMQDKVNSVGAGAVFQVVPDSVTLHFDGSYQKVDGRVGFTTDPNSTYQKARASMGGVKDIPNADNTKIARVTASVDYSLTSAWTLTVGSLFEDYEFSDVDSSNLQYIYPGSAFFLAMKDGSYNGKVGYVRLSYHW